MKINIIANRNTWFVLSGVLVLSSILAVAFIGLRFGIDFTGGSLLEVEVQQPVQAEEVRVSMADVGYTNLSIQASGEQGLIIRTEDLTEEEHQTLLTALEGQIGEVEELRFDSIGPVVGEELRRTATTGIVVTLLLIGLYIAWAFRKVTEPVASWKYGFLTIFAAFHDVVITVGAFSVLGYVYGWEIGTAFVAAILTILGYSINDTVVVFDRTRENLLKRVGDTFEETVEVSIEQTITRSINTSLTTILALLAIFLFGGDSTRPFACALMIGIGVGTYSSIFLASPLLVAWELRKKK
ncbi:protein translocase subunit SecF [Candidatus Uhrbacteria bacterium CG10_big_fil_rev_8_21_14_0_10_48_16]|uniref:Protein-export membrane protein SecF n=1 Tax=Candidatus Uhrbacteria bacterium CG10_big_fil_rev_8_21_14_0_10_48_16 TaxID=1975038 RepID=A0A2M8LGD5_9BACT|nr:MAG: protein translocase subunit SecF [Candidatus Uhrbacteria bacterium CG10_big_fil_rev_8_21_14_0_10_48_16]